MSQKIYSKITNQILEKLQNGVVPWKRGWTTGRPRNIASGRYYRGINILTLALAPHTSSWWGTYKQITSRGGVVKKGSKGYPVCFWKMQEVKDKLTQKTREIPFIRLSTVFNREQTEGLSDDLYLEPHEIKDNYTIPSCEEVIDSYLSKTNPPSVHLEGHQPYYSPQTDVVNVPKLENFSGPHEFYSTFFHELIHSTGHKSRLDRDLSSRFGTHSYSKEELVAEIGACFLCGVTQIENKTIDNSAAYIKGWIAALKNDPQLIVQAASKAQKAADFIYQ